MANPKSTIIMAHVAGWLLFFCLPVAFLYSQNGQDMVARILTSPAYWLFCGSFLFLFYFVNYFLAPRLYLKRKYFAFFSILIVLFAAFYVLKPFDRLMAQNRPEREPMEMHPPPEGPPPGFDKAPPPGRRRITNAIISIHTLSFYSYFKELIWNFLRQKYF